MSGGNILQVRLEKEQMALLEQSNTPLPQTPDRGEKNRVKVTCPLCWKG